MKINTEKYSMIDGRIDDWVLVERDQYTVVGQIQQIHPAWIVVRTKEGVDHVICIQDFKNCTLLHRPFGVGDKPECLNIPNKIEGKPELWQKPFGPAAIETKEEADTCNIICMRGEARHADPSWRDHSEWEQYK